MITRRVDGDKACQHAKRSCEYAYIHVPVTPSLWRRLRRDEVKLFAVVVNDG